LADREFTMPTAFSRLLIARLHNAGCADALAGMGALATAQSDEQARCWLRARVPEFAN
jgi:hypothetical protein